MTTRRIMLASLVAVLTVSSTASSFAATGFNLNAKGPKNVKLDNNLGKNQAQFSSKAPLENIDGGTAAVSGSFVLDPTNLETTTGKLIVPVNTMQTGIELRDKHLREKDWLDTESFPNITFDIKKLTNVSIVSSGGGKGVAKATAEGVLTLHGVAKPITATIELTYVEKAPSDVVMVKAEFNISLKDYNVQGRKGIIGSKVSDTIAMKATLFGSIGG